MGYISKLAKASQPVPAPVKKQNSRGVWREVFQGHSVTKEDHLNELETNRGRSVVSTDAATKRLLQALRSMAPGGWSDDRWEQTRHFNGIPYVAIHRAGEQLSQAEFQVYEVDSKHPDGKRPAKSKGGEDLIKLLEKPNPEDSFGDMMYRWNQQLGLTGMALTWMVPNRLGYPMELYSIPTAIAVPQPAVNPDFPDGYYRIQPVYPYGPFSSYPTPASSVGAPIPAQWMMRFQFPHPVLRYDGYSPMTAMRRQIDQLEAMEMSRWYSMKRTFRPNVVLNLNDMEGSQTLPQAEIDRLRTEIENAFMGPENVGNLFVSAPGSRLEEFGTRPVDMDYPSGWDQVSAFVLGGGFGMTKPAAGMIEDSSYSNLYASLKQLYWLLLDPLTNRFAAKLTRHLAPFFGDNLIIEIRCKRLDDHEISFQRIDKGILAKCMTKNEVRQELGFPITKESWGDEIAGSESPDEMQQGMPGAPGMPGVPGAPALPGPVQGGPGAPGVVEQGANPEPGSLLEQMANEARSGPGGDELREIEKERPIPGKPAAGSMPPKVKRSPFAQRRIDILNKALANVPQNGVNGHHKKEVVKKEETAVNTDRVNLQPVIHVHVPQHQVTVNVPEQKPIVNVTLPEVKPHVSVNVPENSPVVNVSLPEVKPHVDVHVPEHKTVVNVEPTPVQVSVPTPSVVNQVNVQERETPVRITLESPKKTTRVEKSIVYGATGRPEKVVEETREE